MLGAAFTPPLDEPVTVTVPSLDLCGGKSAVKMQAAEDALAAAIPKSQHRTLPGQTRQVSVTALAPVIAEFFAE